MKKILFTLVVVAGFLIVGCQNNPVDSNPIPQQQTNQLAKQNNSALSSLLNSDSSELTITQEINGNKGGIIRLHKTYFDGLRVVTVSAKVKFPAGSFDGTLPVSLTVNADDASINFTPHIVFNKLVSLNLTFLGIDISSLGLEKSNKVKFAYISDDGSFEIISNHGISLGKNVGLLAVHNAELKHFSRYSFVK